MKGNFGKITVAFQDPVSKEMIHGTKEIIEDFFNALANRARISYLANEGRLPFSGKDLAYEIGGNADFPRTSELLLASEETFNALAEQVIKLLAGEKASPVFFTHPQHGDMYLWLDLSETYNEGALIVLCLLVSDNKENRPERGTGDTVVMCRMHKVA